METKSFIYSFLLNQQVIRIDKETENVSKISVREQRTLLLV